MDTSVRKGAEPPSRRCIRPIMFLATIGILTQIESTIGGERMDTDVRKGGITALPPLHTTTNVSSEDGKS